MSYPKSRVFITHEQNKFDYAPAQAFGELHPVSSKVYSFAPGNSVNVGIMTAIAVAAAEFDPVSDFVLPSGSAIMTSLFMVAVAARGVTRLRMLMWSTADEMYSICHLDLKPLIIGGVK